MGWIWFIQYDNNDYFWVNWIKNWCYSVSRMCMTDPMFTVFCLKAIKCVGIFTLIFMFTWCFTICKIWVYAKKWRIFQVFQDLPYAALHVTCMSCIMIYTLINHSSQAMRAWEISHFWYNNYVASLWAGLKSDSYWEDCMTRSQKIMQGNSVMQEESFIFITQWKSSSLPF